MPAVAQTFLLGILAVQASADDVFYREYSFCPKAEDCTIVKFQFDCQHNWCRVSPHSLKTTRMPHTSAAEPRLLGPSQRISSLRDAYNILQDIDLSAIPFVGQYISSAVNLIEASLPDSEENPNRNPPLSQFFLAPTNLLNPTNLMASPNIIPPLPAVPLVPSPLSLYSPGGATSDSTAAPIISGSVVLGPDGLPLRPQPPAANLSEAPGGVALPLEPRTPVLSDSQRMIDAIAPPAPVMISPPSVEISPNTTLPPSTHEPPLSAPIAQNPASPPPLPHRPAMRDGLGETAPPPLSVSQGYHRPPVDLYSQSSYTYFPPNSASFPWQMMSYGQPVWSYPWSPQDQLFYAWSSNPYVQLGPWNVAPRRNLEETMVGAFPTLKTGARSRSRSPEAAFRNWLSRVKLPLQLRAASSSFELLEAIEEKSLEFAASLMAPSRLMTTPSPNSGRPPQATLAKTLQDGLTGLPSIGFPVSRLTTADNLPWIPIDSIPGTLPVWLGEALVGPYALLFQDLVRVAQDGLIRLQIAFDYLSDDPIPVTTDGLRTFTDQIAQAFRVTLDGGEADALKSIAATVRQLPTLSNAPDSPLLDLTNVLAPVNGILAAFAGVPTSLAPANRPAPNNPLEGVLGNAWQPRPDSYPPVQVPLLSGLDKLRLPDVSSLGNLLPGLEGLSASLQPSGNSLFSIPGASEGAANPVSVPQIANPFASPPWSLPDPLAALRSAESLPDLSHLSESLGLSLPLNPLSSIQSVEAAPPSHSGFQANPWMLWSGVRGRQLTEEDAADELLPLLLRRLDPTSSENLPWLPLDTVVAKYPKEIVERMGEPAEWLRKVGSAWAEKSASLDAFTRKFIDPFIEPLLNVGESASVEVGDRGPDFAGPIKHHRPPSGSTIARLNDPVEGDWSHLREEQPRQKAANEGSWFENLFSEDAFGDLFRGMIPEQTRGLSSANGLPVYHAQSPPAGVPVVFDLREMANEVKPTAPNVSLSPAASLPPDELDHSSKHKHHNGHNGHSIAHRLLPSCPTCTIELHIPCAWVSDDPGLADLIRQVYEYELEWEEDVDDAQEETDAGRSSHRRLPEGVSTQEPAVSPSMGLESEKTEQVPSAPHIANSIPQDPSRPAIPALPSQGMPPGLAPFGVPYPLAPQIPLPDILGQNVLLPASPIDLIKSMETAAQALSDAVQSAPPPPDLTLADTLEDANDLLSEYLESARSYWKEKRRQLPAPIPNAESLSSAVNDFLDLLDGPDPLSQYVRGRRSLGEERTRMGEGEHNGQGDARETSGVGLNERVKNWSEGGKGLNGDFESWISDLIKSASAGEKPEAWIPDGLLSDPSSFFAESSSLFSDPSSLLINPADAFSGFGWPSEWKLPTEGLDFSRTSIEEAAKGGLADLMKGLSEMILGHNRPPTPGDAFPPPTPKPREDAYPAPVVDEFVKKGRDSEDTDPYGGYGVGWHEGGYYDYDEDVYRRPEQFTGRTPTRLSRQKLNRNGAIPRISSETGPSGSVMPPVEVKIDARGEDDRPTHRSWSSNASRSHSRGGEEAPRLVGQIPSRGW